MLEKYRADCAFIGIGGLSEEMLFTDFTEEGMSLREAMIQSSDRSIALADKTKIGKHTPFRLTITDQIDSVITDAALSIGLCQKLSDRSIQIHQVNDLTN